MRVLFGFLCSLMLIMAAGGLNAEAADVFIKDSADYLTDEQEKELKTEAQRIADKTGWNIAYVTDSSENKTEWEVAVSYSESMYESFFGEERGVLYFCGLDWRHLVVTHDLEATYLTQPRIDALLDSCEGEYRLGYDYGVASVYLMELEKYYDKGLKAPEPAVEVKKEHKSKNLADVNPIAVLAIMGFCGIIGGFAGLIVINTGIPVDIPLECVPRAEEFIITAQNDVFKQYIQADSYRSYKTSSSVSRRRSGSSSGRRSGGIRHGGGSRGGRR
ncbi:MAG: TPM domain-containing protein [Oscillospiraceae bacterium]|nr:TPM domain-containing protein [Oscillospiraceae bacterium]